MSATSSFTPLRLLLLVLLAVSALGTVQMARRERGDEHAKGVTARAAVRAPAGRGMPDAPVLLAALPAAAPLLAASPTVSAPDITPPARVRPARPGRRAASARAPPR